ncbi:MAG: beta-ketoacyl-[acyl-carrier-protein] synthase family protein [Crocinitomicaceae bacterium]|nr:beta-ketoacyl-[acyl-carrier-protein] synthase family protein [Crocinitomicaceae bacterium]
MKIFITGIGAISCIGNNVEDHYNALVSEKSGIKKGKQSFSERYLVGEVPLSDEALIQQFNLKTAGSRTALLGCIAAKEAFANHRVDTGIRTGVISGTSVGGMDYSEVQYRSYIEHQTHDLTKYNEHSSGNSSEYIAKELGVYDFITTISTACSSAANAIMMGARMIQAGLLDRAIVGGTDALTEFTISGFRSLMIFDEEWCRPFDESRKGLNLGEGAGYIVIESEASMKKSGSKSLAQLKGWSNASDAYHQTASSPEGYGATLSISEALKTAQLKPEDIDYINAHGTATPNNDLSESKAILTVFGDTIPPVSSTKAFTGHTLAAAGGLEAVFSVLAIQNACLFANLNYKNAIEETKIVPVTKTTKVNKIRNVLSNSFGFGGNNSTIIIGEI